MVYFFLNNEIKYGELSFNINQIYENLEIFENYHQGSGGGIIGYPSEIRGNIEVYSGAKPDQTSVFYIELKEDKYLENDFSIENTQYIHKLFIVEEKHIIL